MIYPYIIHSLSLYNSSLNVEEYMYQTKSDEVDIIQIRTIIILIIPKIDILKK